MSSSINSFFVAPFEGRGNRPFLDRARLEEAGRADSAQDRRVQIEAVELVHLQISLWAAVPAGIPAHGYAAFLPTQQQQVGVRC